MTREPDRNAALDAVIDDVAAAMTRAALPDLRVQIGARLDRSNAGGIRWWRPAAALALLTIACVWWNAGREPAPVIARPPAAVTVSTSPVRRTEGAPTSAPTAPNRLMQRTRAMAGRARSWPALDAVQAGFEPAAPAPLTVEPLVESASERIAPVDISAIAVSAIVVDPLPRNMP